jgi:hypothetical protein
MSRRSARNHKNDGLRSRGHEPCQLDRSCLPPTPADPVSRYEKHPCESTIGPRLPAITIHLRFHRTLPRRCVHTQRPPPRTERVACHRAVVPVRPHAVAASTGSRVRVARTRAPTRPAAPVRPARIMRCTPRRTARLGVATLRTRRLSPPAVRIRRLLPILPLAPHLAAPRPPATRRRAGRPRRRLPRKPPGHANPRLAVRGFRANAAGHVTNLPAFVRRLKRSAPAPCPLAQRLVRRRPACIHRPRVRRHVTLLRCVGLDIGRAAILSGRLHVLEGEDARPAQHRAQATSDPRAASGKPFP